MICPLLSHLLKKRIMYRYYAYGLKIASDTVFEQFVRNDFEGEADLQMHHYVEDSVKEILVNDNQVCVRGKDIFFRNYAGFFEARLGNEIFYEEHEGVNEAVAKEFVMGNVMALLFLERGLNVIHGAAVRYRDKTIIISGNSGAGKSTVTTELIRRGAKLITDDQAVISFENGEPVIIPGYPSQKLCEDAARRNELEIDELVKVDDTKNKYAIPRIDSFYSEISRVDAAFFISRHEEGENLVAGQVTGARKADVITKNLFLKPFFTTTMPIPPKMMMDCITLAGKILVYEISRKSNAQTLDGIIDYIDSTLVY